MKLVRRYFNDGTNGAIHGEGGIICYTIELRWLDNAKQKSCIPEGIYKILPFKSKKHGDVYRLKDVPQRSAILIHAANDAKKELKGCISPVTRLSGEGKGTDSRKAMKKLFEYIKQNNIAEIEITHEKN